MINNLYLLLIFSLLGFNSCGSQEKIIYKDVLKNDSLWVIEQQPGGTVHFQNNKMKVTDAKGCTVWFKNKLEGHIKITYDITIIDEGGLHDRVSDMNCFWMANDPINPDDFFKNSRCLTAIVLNCCCSATAGMTC